MVLVEIAEANTIIMEERATDAERELNEVKTHVAEAERI